MFIRNVSIDFPGYFPMRISIRKIFFVCIVLGGTAYGITILRGSHSISGFEEKRRQIEQLEKENEKLQREIAEKQNYLGRLQQNPDELKLEIQRRLKLVSPNTKQFILQDGTPSDTPPASQPHP
jgi:cell division protein FtsB